jgi:hypothetical protein
MTRPGKLVFVIVDAQIDDTARGCGMLINHISISVQIVDDTKLEDSVVFGDDKKLVVEAVAGIVVGHEHHVGSKEHIAALRFDLLEASDLRVPVVQIMQKSLNFDTTKLIVVGTNVTSGTRRKCPKLDVLCLASIQDIRPVIEATPNLRTVCWDLLGRAHGATDKPSEYYPLATPWLRFRATS